MESKSSQDADTTPEISQSTLDVSTGADDWKRDANLNDLYALDFEEIQLGEVNSDCFGSSEPLQVALIDIEELGFISHWDAIITPVESIEPSEVVVELLTFDMDLSTIRKILATVVLFACVYLQLHARCSLSLDN